MIHKYLTHLAGLLLLLTVTLSCNKEIEEPSSITAQVSSDSRIEKDDCRLTQELSDYGQIDYTYNKKGLMDTYKAPYMNGAYFQHEYKHGRLVISRMIFENAPFLTIYFYYNNKFGKVDHEVWYDGDASSKTKIDEVFYLFDYKGRSKKMISNFLDYTANYFYDKNDNLTKYTFYSAGVLNYVGEFTYFQRLKNPSGAIPGLEYDYYSVSGTYNRNKWYSTSAKLVFWENGVPTILQDQDPTKTIMKGNKQHYPIQVSYFERTGPRVDFDFTYENCESCKPRDKNAPANSSRMSVNQTTQQLMLKPVLKKKLGIK